jgi:hypothetical protein
METMKKETGEEENRKAGREIGRQTYDRGSRKEICGEREEKKRERRG